MVKLCRKFPENPIRKREQMGGCPSFCQTQYKTLPRCCVYSVTTHAHYDSDWHRSIARKAEPSKFSHHRTWSRKNTRQCLLFQQNVHEFNCPSFRAKTVDFFFLCWWKYWLVTAFLLLIFCSLKKTQTRRTLSWTRTKKLMSSFRCTRKQDSLSWMETVS